MRATYCSILLACIFGLAVPAAWGQQKPDFSGNWKRDPLRSRIDGVEHAKELVLNIEHKEPALHILAKRTTDSGEATDSYDLVTDGSARQEQVAGQPATVSAHWDNWKGTRLIVEAHTGSGAGEVVTTRQMILGEKGKILTTVLTVHNASGEKKGYEFFFRQ